MSVVLNYGRVKGDFFFKGSVQLKLVSGRHLIPEVLECYIFEH